ncbi:GC-rich sequence DNA-binding factor 1, partial [Stegodyphus mimosarum]
MVRLASVVRIASAILSVGDLPYLTYYLTLRIDSEMGLFKKPNRKFRQREARPDSDDESSTELSESKAKSVKTDVKDKPSTSVEADNNASTSNSSTVLLQREKEEKTDPSLAKGTKLLSFHDEEDDGEVFKLKKSNYSRRLAKQREKEKKKKEESQASTSITVKEDPREDLQCDSNINNKSKPNDSWNILSGNNAEDMEVESDEDQEKNNPFKNVLQSGIIPDAATIYAMKKHRQMAREMGDFIPVEDPEKEDDTKSRLIREDDNDRSDDDEDDEPSRLSFTVNTGAVERQKIRETFLSLQEGSTNELETEEAAELDRWEREQIRKGVGVTQVGPSQNSEIAENQLYSYTPVSISTTASYVPESTENVSIPCKPLPSNLLKSSGPVLTTSDIKSRLEERLSSLKTSHEAHKQELQHCQKEFIETNKLIKKLEEEGPERAQNFSLYQQMSGYVKDLVECLDLKVAHMELLDGRMMGLYKSRAEKLIFRRQQDVRDQSDEFSVLSSEIQKGVSAEFLFEKNICTDEVKLRRAAEREGRRMRRRKQRERGMVIVKHQDGMSSDDEEPDLDILEFKTMKENIIEEANSVFEDVVEEFGTLEGVMINFEKWKYEQIDSYCEAFVPLCLPKIFGTFVKLALLDWNPLTDEKDFEKSSWYRQLVYYGYSNLKLKDNDSEDPDTNLLPGIMEKIVLPKITGFIQNVWDPLSRKETSKLVKLITDLHENYPTINGKSKQLQICLKAVTTRIYKALD